MMTPERSESKEEAQQSVRTETFQPEASATPPGGPAHARKLEPPAGQAQRIRCPHCHNPIVLLDDRSEEVLCPGCGSPFCLREASHTDTVSTSRQLGKFQLLERVGVGAFGAVWRARDTELDRIVALKIPHTGLLIEKDDLERFHREARAAAQLRHPGIVTVHEVVMLEGLPAIVSDFIAGAPLKDLLEVRQLSFRESAELIARVAEALDYAHAQGLVHRDIKPANIMIDRGQPGQEGHASVLGKPLLLDFGLALRSDAEVTMTLDGHVLGTPAYMSPEQAEGKSHAADQRSDVYSLGVVLYQLLTGELPFRGSRLMILQQVLTEDPRPPRKVKEKVPRDLETICLKCLRKEPEKRYQAAKDLAQDLRHFLSDEPILARPASSVERTLKWVKRRPAFAALIALAFLLVLALGASGVSFLFVGELRALAGRLAEEKRSAEEARDAEMTARKRAEAAEVKAQQQRELARLQAARTLGSLYEVVIKTDEMLGTKAGTAPLRQKLVDMAKDRLKEIEGTDKADRTLGVALQHMGLLFNRAGKTEQEIDAYKRSLEIFERLIGEKPEEVDCNRYDAAVSYNNLGEIGRENKPNPARAFEPYEKSCTLYRDLVLHPNQAKPEMFKREHGLSACYVKLTMLSLVVGDPARAREYAAEAVKHAKATASQFPNQAGQQEVLAGAYFALGKASARVPDENEARQSYDRSMELRQKMIDADVTNAYASQELARTVVAVGDLEMELHHVSKALGHYRKAHEMFEGLSKKERDNLELQWYLSNADYSLAIALEAQGDKEAALKLRQSCAKTREALLKEDPKNPQRKIEVMLIRARLGQIPEATELAADIKKFAPHHPGMLFSVACCYALCMQQEADIAQQRSLGEKAAAALRQAVEQGYRDLRGLQSDPDLQPLRGWPAYEEMVKRLAKN